MQIAGYVRIVLGIPGILKCMEHRHAIVEEKRTGALFEYYTLLYFLLALAGWLWEVLLYFVTEHAWINRGVYRGPYLPIYGIGGTLLCLFLYCWRNRPLVVFFISAVSCAALEYAASFFLEEKWGIRWWDYSGHFLNIQGRICLLSTVAFGIGGVFLVCFFLPLYNKLYEKMSDKWRRLLMLILLLVFTVDAAYCAMNPNVGYGITESKL